MIFDLTINVCENPSYDENGRGDD